MREKVKISEITPATSLVGLWSIGVNGNNDSVKISLSWLKEASDNLTVIKSNAEKATGAANKAATDANAQMVQLSQDVSQIVGETNNAKEAANDAAEVALNVAIHPTIIGPDNYVYEWDLEAQQYVKTNVYAKGDTGLKGDKGDKGETGDRGLQGLKGDKGDQGEQGLKGEKGDQGVQGVKGDKGDKGDTGSGFAVLGYFDTLGDLETAVSSPVAGDAYGVGLADPYDIYIYDAINLRWVNNGPLQGVQGIQGEKGAQGERGLKGEPGATGPTGPKGDAGAAGARGATGAAGPAGSQGVKGDKGDTGPAGTNTNMVGATTSVAGKAGLAPAPAAGAATRYLRSDGTWQVPQDTIYTHPTGEGSNHIPAGGTAGQFLKWSSTGVAVWAADNNTTYGLVTTTVNGLMSAADKAKLDTCPTGSGFTKMQKITQAAYDALASKDANTLYLITG